MSELISTRPYLADWCESALKSAFIEQASGCFSQPNFKRSRPEAIIPRGLFGSVSAGRERQKSAEAV